MVVRLNTRWRDTVNQNVGRSHAGKRAAPRPINEALSFLKTPSGRCPGRIIRENPTWHGLASRRRVRDHRRGSDRRSISARAGQIGGSPMWRVGAAPCIGLLAWRKGLQLERDAAAEGVTESGEEETGTRSHAGEGLQRPAERPRIPCGTRSSGGTMVGVGLAQNFPGHGLKIVTRFLNPSSSGRIVLILSC